MTHQNVNAGNSFEPPSVSVQKSLHLSNIGNGSVTSTDSRCKKIIAELRPYKYGILKPRQLYEMKCVYRFCFCLFF